jgi:hypothetical protein
MCWPSTDTGHHVLRLDPATYRRHAIHGEDRAWVETNCYTDLVVELAHAHGFEPRAMLPYTLAIDFEGDQWTFFKPAPCDLYELYGFDIQELSIWRPLADAVAEQVERGHVVLVEIDSHYLPDTAGTAYRLEHSKTTVGVNAIDPERERMGYFHNAGYFALEGEDFRAAFRREGLAPYVEYVKPRRDFTPPSGSGLVALSAAIAGRHVERIPRDNPFPRFKARFERDLVGLARRDICFHDYSFNTLRQFGSCYELAATWLDWMGENGVTGVDRPASALRAIAEGAKALQFQLARSLARAKPLDLAPIDAMAEHWDNAFGLLRSRLG